MRYITRQLHQSVQDLELAPNEVKSRWREACESYQAELNAIKPRLPASMRSFADVTLHDGVIKSAVQPLPSSVELQVDATDNPWGPTGWYRVEFRGVREVEGLADVIGDEWLYEEVHLHPSAAFEYCVLLAGSEFRVVADDVVFEPLSDSRETA